MRPDIIGLQAWIDADWKWMGKEIFYFALQVYAYVHLFPNGLPYAVTGS